MTEADRLNAVLEREAPGAWRCLSPIGRAAAFPRGIPFQAAQARGAEFNATIGEISDGKGNPLPLPSIAHDLAALDAKTSFLYGPVDGPPDVREAWLARQRRISNASGVPASLPMMTHGLTHSLSLISALFADSETTLIIPAPFWENYPLVFGLFAQARVRTFDALAEAGGFSMEGLRSTLASTRGKAMLLLNFPCNPTGYMPSPSEIREIASIVAAHPHPLVTICDDAYQGFVYTSAAQPFSPYWALANAVDPERGLVIKVDGATKELVFFSSRIGFLTHNATGDAEAALSSKLKTVARATVGSPPGPSVAAIARALAHPTLESDFAARVALMKSRWQTLTTALEDLPEDLAVARPFNSAFFAFLELKRPGADAEQARQRLLHDFGVGAIAFPEHNALRIAFCSLEAERLPELVSRLRRALSD